MNKAGKPNSLLIELVIVLLFFSLSAVVILQLFVAAHDKSVDSAVGTEATLMAEDIAERFRAGGLEPGVFLAGDGWTEAAGAYTRQAEASGHAVRLTADVAREVTPAGSLDTITLTVYDDDSVVVSLPVVRYSPGEGTV